VSGFSRTFARWTQLSPDEGAATLALAKDRRELEVHDACYGSMNDEA
jgi:hypothetical protein